MARHEEAAVRALIQTQIDRTSGDAAFLCALAELGAPVREQPAEDGRLSLRRECLRMLRRPERSRKALMWIGWIQEEHARWREAHPLVPLRPGPELLELPAVPDVTRERCWTTGQLAAIARFVNATARRRLALMEFVQARLDEYCDVLPPGGIEREQDT